MSIIYDALKKVEKSVGQKIPLDPLPSKPKFNRVYFIYIAVALVGIALSKILFDFFIIPAQIEPPKIVKADIRPRRVEKETLKNETPPQKFPEEATLPSLFLNGVFFSENEGYALINNRILKVGDTIEGAEVKEITLDSVELKFKDRGISISTRGQ